MMRVAPILCACLAFGLPAFAQQNKPAAPAAPAQTAPSSQSPLPTLNIIVPQRDRDATFAYYRGEIAAGRCPAPLVRKDKTCVAPAPAKIAWKLDQPLPEGIKAEAPPAALISKLSASPAGNQYMRVGNDILIMGVGTRIVTALVVDLSNL